MQVGVVRAGPAKHVLTQGILLGCIGLVAYAVRGAVGAAGNMVANAILLCLVALQMSAGLPLREGIYWAALAGALSGVVMGWYVLREWRPERFVFLVMLGAVPANVTFTVILTRIDTQQLMSAMSVVTIGTGVYLMLRQTAPDISERTLNRLAVPVGALSGALGGLFGMGGPPLFILLGKASRDPSLFRARVTVIATTTNLVRVGVLFSLGAFTGGTMSLLAISVPFILVGTGIGLWVHQFIRPRPFRLVLGVLVMIGGLTGLLSTL